MNLNDLVALMVQFLIGSTFVGGLSLPPNYLYDSGWRAGLIISMLPLRSPLRWPSVVALSYADI